jgi:carnitine monooxygenase subunit
MGTATPLSKVTQDAARSQVLAAGYYTDPAVFEFERRALFHHAWIFVGHASQVARPGDCLPVDVLDEPLIVARDRDGELRAFYNVCAHRGMRILDKPGQHSLLPCPYHSWVYNLSGRLVRVRMGDQLCDFDKADYCLPSVKVCEIQSLLFVNLDPHAAPIGETIGGCFEDLTRFGSDPYSLVPVQHVDLEIRANWKLAIDNYVESYHTEVAHPGFSDYADFEQAFVEAHPWYAIMGGPPSEATRREYEQGGELTITENRYNWAWPTTMVLYSPGPRNLTVWQALPVAYDRTVFRQFIYFDSAELSPQQKRHIELNVEILEQDRRLVEGVWSGLRSQGFRSGGRYVVRTDTQRSEVAVHQFHCRLQELYDRHGIRPHERV